MHTHHHRKQEQTGNPDVIYSVTVLQLLSSNYYYDVACIGFVCIWLHLFGVPTNTGYSSYSLQVGRILV